MEDSNKPGQPATPGRSSGVMDVQRPKSSLAVAEPPAPSQPAEAPTPVEEPKPAPDVAVPTEVTNATPPEDHSPEPPAKDEPKNKDDVHPLLAAHAQKKHGPVVPIVTAVVIALALIGVTVFAFLKTKDSSNSTGDHPATHQETTTPATSSDVDNASQQVDEALAAVDDTKDFADSQLTDQTLGL